ncbi:VWA domain-containing protein [Nocardia salmonicida]|uniref:VWA domain-containing protein n=1 Tax=Nocardia salmonicida TaxID=53431 RepID=UPI002E27BEA0|nr:VWA domain-containing protein [Nocardia salmonicida]
MTAALLRKGENAVLTFGSLTCTVAPTGGPVDVSALLVATNGAVRSDNDLVFYNHPSQDGVSVAGMTVTVELSRVPRDVDKIIIVASADPLHPGTVFTTAPLLTLRSTAGPELQFTAPDFSAGETVVLLAEIYRRSDSWKVRAVGQGYSSGLAGLATDFGVTVDDEPATAPPRTNGPTSHAPAASSVELTKVASQAPALLAPARQAGQALASSGLANCRAAVYLVLDHDYDMKDMYESFAIQAFAERVLALSVNLDDDGIVPVIFSGEDEPFLEEISLTNYRGRIGQLHTQVDWGWGNVTQAMRRIVSHYQESGSSDPVLAIVQVGSEPYDKAEIRSLLQNTASMGVFWLFVGFGRGKLAFYKNLNASASATFSNVAFYDAGKNPGAVPGEQFYTGLVDAFGVWARR